MAVTDENKHDSIEVVQGIDISALQSEKTLNLAENSMTLDLTSAYHMSEITQNETIIKTARGIIWCGFVVMCIGILLVFFGKISEAIITSASGLIADFISAIIFAFVTKSNESKLKYFEQLSNTAECDKLMQMISKLENKKAQEKLLDKMVTSYCERRKGN